MFIRIVACSLILLFIGMAKTAENREASIAPFEIKTENGIPRVIPPQKDKINKQETPKKKPVPENDQIIAVKVGQAGPTYKVQEPKTEEPKGKKP